jgi:catechol 2,3-dioxygenase-like lactoylglutathione lyase family enzyme
MASVEFTGIRHVKLAVSDLARSREWYERVLGYTVRFEFPDDDGVVRGVGGRLPGVGAWVALRQNPQAAAGNSGFDPVGFAIADRVAAEAWSRISTRSAYDTPGSGVPPSAGWSTSTTRTG